MKYTGTSDGVAKGKRKGTERFTDLCRKRFGFTCLGTWVVRDMKGKTPPQLSVHATARALDVSYGTDKESGLEAILWFVEHAETLGIEEVHDYSGITKKGCEQYGRGWRCDRHGKPGWKDWSESDNAGSFHATWIHVELCPAMADDDDALEAAWRSLPKKGAALAVKAKPAK